MSKQLITLLVPLLFLSCSSKQSAERAGADGNSPAVALVRRHIAAVGGDQAFRKISSHQREWDVREGADRFTAQTSIKAPDKFLLTIKITGIEVRQGHDGAGHWWRQVRGELREAREPKEILEFREMWLCLNPVALPQLLKDAQEL